MNKKETSEQTTGTPPAGVTKTTKTTDEFRIGPNASMKVGNAVVSNKGGQTTVEMMENELEEEFESEAQQKLFWARCDKCKSKNCKWCKMANEFQEKTKSKELPKKLHPEKTVKYKKDKKETKEEFTFKDYGKKLESAITNKLGNQALKTLRPTFENINEKELDKLVKESLMPTLTKKDLLKLVESEIKRKKNLTEDFYMEEMDEELDFDFMSDVETAPIIKPKIKPKRETEPEWSPDEDEPIVPSPNVNPEPQARSSEEKSRMNSVEREQLKRQFYMDLARIENATHKPHKFKRFK
jgi:hypothetical protein